MIVRSMIIDNIERSMHKSLAIIVEEKDISHYCSFNKKISSTIKKIWVSKGSHVLTNHQGLIKVWVPKFST